MPHSQIETPLLAHCSGYLGGKWFESSDCDRIPVHNPATGEVLANVPNMSERETIEAIEAASDAGRTVTPLAERKHWLYGIAERLRSNRDSIARIITSEQGKPLGEATTEVDYAAGFFDFFSGQLEQLEASDLGCLNKNHKWTVHHRPVGVVGLITPWNFPLAMLAKKLSAALGAGCGIVAKPSELTPLSAIAMWAILHEVGVPSGLCNLVIGKPEPIGKVLCEHKDVRLISFTGSTMIGKWLIQHSAAQVKRLALELGGNAPFIVLADADLPLAVDALMQNKFRAGGQTCVCTNRVLVHKSVADKFIDLVTKRVQNLKTGNGMEPNVDIGPMMNRAGFNKVSKHVEDALSQGAKRLVGETPPLPAEAWGCFYPPTVLKGVGPGMLLWQEETFGPVVAIHAFEHVDDAIALANGTPYGLAAYLFTQDRERAIRIVSQLEFGHVGINTGAGPTPQAPFGGMKQSGFGREGGLEGLLEFCESQTVVSA